jgi:hypothetical protein
MYNLLQSEETKSISLEELLLDDPLRLLDSDEEGDSIFKLSHVKPTDRLRPDYIARLRGTPTLCFQKDESPCSSTDAFGMVTTAATPAQSRTRFLLY